jgi:hypothetical protein
MSLVLIDPKKTGPWPATMSSWLEAVLSNLVSR